MRAYRLDAANVVQAVQGEWDSFARENGGYAAQDSAVRGRLLWDMIHGAATTCFLDRMFYDCRATQTALGLLYRCDSPAVERLFLMRVEPADRGGLLVSHRLIRSRGLLIAPLRELGHIQYRKCSQCLACNFGGPWVEAGRFHLPVGAVAVDAVCPVCRAAAYLTKPQDAAERPRLSG